MSVLESSLSTQNTSLHQILDTLYLQMLEALTALQFQKAIGLWQELCVKVKGHMAYEEEVLLPLFTDLQLDKKNNLASGKTGQLVHGDHIILLRTEAGIHAAFQALLPLEGQDSARRQMILNLDLFLRWMRVMEHHTDRETRTFYAPFDEALDDKGRSLHAKALLKATLHSAISTTKKERAHV